MKAFFKTKIELSLLWRILIYLGLSCFVLLFCVYLQPGSLTNTLKNFLHEPRLLLLNLFPILAVLGVLAALLGNLFWAGSLTVLLLPLLSLANLIKMECRKDPLVPGDFALLGEAMVATGEYKLDLHLPYAAIILVCAAALVILGIKLKTREKLWVRLAATLLLIGLFIGAMCTVYPSQALYQEVVATVDQLSTSNVPAVFDETGFLYCFLHNYQLYEVDKPAGYSTEEAAAWAASGGTAPILSVPVDIILVQAEAFSDIYDAEIFDYAPGENPLELYHQVANSEQAISGHIVVSNYGAGTANTEFDILTGVETNMLHENASSAFRVIHKGIPTLARTLDEFGYENWFMHPGENWFYNRESVYHYFGMHNQTFRGGFVGEYRWKGGYLSDEAFGVMLKQQYTESRSSGAPWFAFTVTIQNHQAYPWTKYDPRPELIPLKRSLSDEATETLSVYAEGIRDSSRLLMELTEFFDQQDSPALVVFWGDHLPALGKSFQVYQEIGLGIGNEADLYDAIDTYTTPFVIWGNRAYCERFDLAAAKQALELPAGNRISDIYLGELVYELAGLQGADPYWDFLGQARRILPVICKGRYLLPDGSAAEVLTPEQQAVEEKLRKWGYYRIVEERVGP